MRFKPRQPWANGYGDPSYFAVKVHPCGALLSPHHSQLTLLQHLIIQSPFLKQPVQFLAGIPKYWLENDGNMCLNDSHRWQLEKTIAWLRKHGLHTVPNSIKAEIGDLVYNGPKKKSLDKNATFAPPPGRVVVKTHLEECTTRYLGFKCFFFSVYRVYPEVEDGRGTFDLACAFAVLFGVWKPGSVLLTEVVW